MRRTRHGCWVGEFRLRTPRLVLRSWRTDDRARFGEVFNTPGMTRHLGGLASEEAVDALFARRLCDQARDGVCYWATELCSTGEVIASCGLRIARNYPGTPVQGMLEAGWRVGEAWQGRGIAREAMAAALDWAWQTRTEARIGSWTRAENLPSLAAMRALGFARRADLDFIRPETLEHCLVHVIERPKTLA